MYTLLLVVAALLPAVLLFLYIWKKDPQKEPMSKLLKAFVWGAAICLPIAIIELVISGVLFGFGNEPTTLIGTTANAFLVAALPEEAAKLLVLWLVLRKNPYFDEHFDGIVYAVCVGLGFAALENIFYVLENGMGNAIMRALLSVPGHYAFAVIMGYCYAIYHFIKPTTINAIKILLMPVMAHGIYDALAMSGTVDPIVGSIAFFVLIYFCIKLQKIAQSRVNTLIQIDKSGSDNLNEMPNFPDMEYNN